MSKGGSVCSTPPPVTPKKWTVKKNPGGNDYEFVKVEKVKVWTERSVNNDCKAQPPPLPAKPPKEKEKENEILDYDSLKDWWKRATPWDRFSEDLKQREEEEGLIIRKKAQHLYKGIRLYDFLMVENGSTLKEHITELHSIAKSIEKVSKGTKIAGITGGATAGLGVVAAAAGVILSPVTFGASLALTAVGVGAVAAGGVTGASAAITNKVKVTHDKKNIKEILKEYAKLVEDIHNCLIFIKEGMEQIQQYDQTMLREMWIDSVRVVKRLAAAGGVSTRAVEVNGKASGLIKGFAIGMDFYFTQGKKGQKLKKGLESKFAKKISTLAEELSEGLDELMQIKTSISEHCG